MAQSLKKHSTHVGPAHSGVSPVVADALPDELDEALSPAPLEPDELDDTMALPSGMQRRWSHR